MSDSSATPVRNVAVLGGGISGLAAAHRLAELAPSVRVALFEAGDRLGGVVRSVHKDGYLIECASDMFITREPWGVDLCRRVGFESQLIETNRDHRRALVVFRGRLYPVPDGFTLMTPLRAWPVATTPLLSLQGKIRLACEWFVPPRKEESDESLASFARRRMGREAYERLIQPLISSIYTADPEKLSMQAAMPQFFALERKYGSLARGMRHLSLKRAAAEGSGARYGLFVGARRGLAGLVEAIAARLPEGCVRLNSAVHRVAPHPAGGWEVSSIHGAEAFDAVILAVPAHRAAQLLGPIDESLAADLRAIPHAGTAIVAAGYHRSQVEHPLDGFGAVIPLVEKRRVLSISFSSNKFPGRAPQGCVLFRVFVGGACQPELLDLADEPLKRLVQEELGELLGARGQPQLCEVFRWPNAMPQYHVGHLDRVRRIEARAAALPRLALAGNAFRGVGLPFCIRSGEQAAEIVLGRLSPGG